MTNGTKLNADKTRFDPRPVGVLLTVRFRDCSRPLPVRYERTPSVPRCQYPVRRFWQSAPAARKRRRRSQGAASSATFHAASGSTVRMSSASHRGAELAAAGLTGQRPSPRSGVILGRMGTARRRVVAAARCSPKAERRQSRLASKPSAFCWLSASGIAPVRVWLMMNVHPACQNVNTPFRRFSEIASLEPPGAGLIPGIAISRGARGTRLDTA
jgi:hypothetical protein